jgi:hypothetical protein
MIFNITYDSSVTSQSAAFQAQFDGAVNAAVQFYEHAFTNNVTVNITFAWANLGAGVAAQNSFFYNTHSYSTTVNALRASGRSADDIAAYATLPVGDPTGGSGNDFALTTAQARALGFSASAPYDDFVTLGSNLAWTFDPNNRAVAGEYDAIGALEHEISEGVFGRIGSLGNASPVGLASGIYTPLDLFRYSSAGVHDYHNPGSNDFFSIDGTHLLTEFNNHNQFGGDVSDWYPTIQGDSFGDAYQGVMGAVTPTDIRELDILGWNVAGVPLNLVGSGVAPVLAGTGVVGTGDFNSDGMADILFNNTGTVAVWEMSGFTATASATILSGLSSAWQIAGTGDFNANHMSDIVLQNTNGSIAIWLMNGTQIQAGGLLNAPSWNVAGVGDFNGDQMSDLVLQQSSAGNIAIWEMNGTQIQAGALINITGWHVAAVGDVNGDHLSDIVLQNATDGSVAVWEMNGLAPYAGAVISGPTSWRVIGTGDFTGDHLADIVLQNTDGSVAIWEMNGTTIQSGAIVGSMTSAWHLVGTGDFFGSGMSDILWQNDNHSVEIWAMNGLQVVAAQVITPPAGQLQGGSSLTTATSTPSAPVLIHTDDLTVVSGSESKSPTNGASGPLDMSAALPGERAALLNQYMASTFVDSGFGTAGSPIAGAAAALSAPPDLLTSPHGA